MREPILKAIEQLQRLQHLYSDWQQHYSEEAALSPSPPRAVSQANHPWYAERDNTQAYQDAYYRQLCACLKQTLDPALVTIMWDFFVTIYIGAPATATGSIVIEISRFGPLAATYIYRAVPSHVIDRVSHCRQALGLIELQQKEIDELENWGIYPNLF